MKRPRVVSERKRALLERSPPPSKRSRPHSWLKEEKRSEIEEALAGTGPLPLYISRTAEEEMRNHSISSGNRNLEAMGLLLGDVFAHSEKTYTVVKNVVTTDLQASGVSVSFHRNGFETLFDRLDKTDFDYIIVGWYHSHPGYTCFMSPKDIETQQRMFREDFHFAVVLDPLKLQIEAFTLSGEGCISVPFAVYWEEHEDPYGRTKKLPLKPR